MADQMRKAFEFISSAVGHILNPHGPEKPRTIRGADPEWLAGTGAEKYVKDAPGQPSQIIASQVETLPRLVEEGKKAAEDGRFKEADKMALQAMVGAQEAMDEFLRQKKPPYTKQHLADWFGTIACIFNSDAPGQQPRVTVSQVETLTRLVEEGNKAAEDGRFKEADKMALQAMVGAQKAMDQFLRQNTSPYTKQHLADWFGTIACIFNLTGRYQNAAECFYTATVFENNWTAQEHGRVGEILWGKIRDTKEDEFKRNFQSFLSFLRKIERSAILAEQLKRWDVSIQISMDIFIQLDSFIRNTKVGAKDKAKNKVLRESLMRVARCACESGNHKMVEQFCHRVLEVFSDYNDPEAFEVWGRSLINVKDYHRAQKKLQLARDNAKNQADVERIGQLLIWVDGHQKKSTDTDVPDPEWLEGTEAARHEKLNTESGRADAQKTKTKHKRPKEREKHRTSVPEQLNAIRQRISETPTGVYQRQENNNTTGSETATEHSRQTETERITQKAEKPRNKSRRHRHLSNESSARQECELCELTSISSCQMDSRDFSSDSDASETSLSKNSDISDATSKVSLEDVEEASDDDSLTFYEKSCRFHGNSGDGDDIIAPKDTKLLREGLQLNASFLHTVKCRQTKERNESFYEQPLDVTQCEQKLKRQPKQFKRCTIQIEGSHLSFCTPIKSDVKISVIEISGRSKAGRTFNEDEVLVEILDVAHEDKDKRYGKVVGILNRERHKNIAHPVFVCTLDDMESHLVRPMCKTVPKIHIMHDEILKKHFKDRKNKIELYTYDHEKGTLEFKKIIDINPADRHKYVFLVAYLQWEREQYSIYPVGAVIQVLPCGDSIPNGLKILDLQHKVPSVYTAATIRRLEGITRRQQDEPPESLYDRHDMTHLDTFTIDPPGCTDIDDALSIENVESGFRVGVHIADVTVYVEKGDAIDKEAQERAVSFYSGVKRPRHMLPEPLSQNICSLVPNKRRLCISVFHYLDNEGEHCRTETKLTVIKSRRQFTYAEVQNIIKTSDRNTSISKSINQLFKLAEKRRRKRLGNSMFALDLDMDDINEDNIEDALEAHYLVEEFMVLTNWKIAKHLVSYYPSLVPQRCQPPPSKENLDCFMRTESSVLNLVLKLQSKKILPPPSLDIPLSAKAENNIMVQKWVWDFITESPEKASRYIKTDELHPLQYLAYEHWLSIQEHAFYKCSGSLKEQIDGKHFALGYTPYTHFTSPIRRYIDIVVHRLVHCMLKKHKLAEYTTDEVENICLHANAMAKRAKAYEKGCKTLKMAKSLKDEPKTIVCFIDEVSDRSVSLCAPELKFVAKTYRELPFNLLDMGFKPEVNEDPRTKKTNVIGKWRKRLYDFTGMPVMPCGFSRETLNLEQHPGFVFVWAWTWAKILKCAIEGRLRDLQTTAEFAKISNSEKGLEDINTEVFDISRLQPNTIFSLSFTRGQALKIQMTAEAQKGILAPKPQLFIVTKSFKCCLQHTDDPVMHLASYSTKPTLDKYPGIRIYLERWLPLVMMEAAVGSVSSEDTSTINNVPVKFKGRSGKFSLSLSFCDLRNIEFGGTIDEGDEEEDICNKSFDFLCIKYMLTKEPTTQQISPASKCFWVGHGEITKVFRRREEEITSKVSQKNGKTVIEKIKSSSGEGKVVIHFDLHQLSDPPPMNEADSNGMLRCGIEVLIKSEVDRRTESFLKKLPEIDCPLAERIALNNGPFHALDDDHAHIAELMDRDLAIPAENDVKPLPINNLKQQEAIDKALGSRFTLIQGPPGTGKTYTGIKLMYLFNKINSIWHREGNKKKQVLFCGPSNKSVDLVARWMSLRLGKLCPKIVRVYGRSIEAVDFPIPGKSFLSKKSTLNAKADAELHSVALHHLIREKGKPFADIINAFDKQFKESNYQSDPEAVKRYLQTIRGASIEELKKHEVILCTTAVGSNPRIRNGTNIFQVIIDESGMCPEPQCLVPIIANKAEQVVLIGDHKQLRPIIMCKEAAELGLEKSLFEKYWESKSARNVQKIMLDTQYRMNPQLCRFPSDTFYHGNLKTESGLWKEGRVLDAWTKRDKKFYPHVFVHVEGEEKVLTVSTEDGNEQSKSNEAELDQVIRVFRYLINEENIPASKVNIISQYNAQCSEIRRRLKNEAFENFLVNTVVSSQGGEWDYVVFSTVRSLPEYKIEQSPTLGWCKQNLGFITDQNQINVALTRARKGLIIIGNKNLLQCDKVWKKLIRHYEQRDCIKTPEEFPPKRTRQKRIQIAIEMSEQRYGDERFIPGNLSEELEPYVPAADERDDYRASRTRFQRMRSQQHNNGGNAPYDSADDGWQQANPRRKGRY